MAGTIEHRWDGTVLTITSDSGTSSCDLKGAKGDTGIRGPQGVQGEPGGAVAVHEANKNNPHEVTWEQIGAAPANHVTDKDNPHGVTAEQVGARPDNWMPTAEQVGARPDNWMPTAAQVGARPDDWLPSLEDINAAPGGYGLGSAQHFTADRLDSLSKPGFFYTDNEMTIAGFTSTRWWMDVSAYGEGAYFATQRISTFYSGNGYVLERHRVNGTWEEWGWKNPPMVAGTEYRTTERWQGKAVYTKMVSFGTLPNNANKTVAHGTGATKMLRVAGTFSNETITLPYHYNGSSADIFVNTTHIYAVTNYNASGHSAYVQIWYTKD